MDPAQPATPRASSAQDTNAAQLAKAALRRLALEKLEPTPENYARAYRQEAAGATLVASVVLPAAAVDVLERLVERSLPSATVASRAELARAFSHGQWEAAAGLLTRHAPPTAASQAESLAQLIERIVRSLERGGRNWTTARKKDSLQRVLASTRNDALRLQQRVAQLVSSWETDTADDVVETSPAPLESPTVLPEPATVSSPIALHLDAQTPPNEESIAEMTALVTQLGHWLAANDTWVSTVGEALPAPPVGQELIDALNAWRERVRVDGLSEVELTALAELSQRVRRMLQHRHHLTEQLGQLCHELTHSLSELAEDDSWAQGQCDAMRRQIEDGLTARSVRSVSELLRTTRERQGQLREERAQARDALKLMINRMLVELGELGSQTGRFHESVGRYADVIEKADSLESLAGVVREMVEESRTVQDLVSQAQTRLQSEHERATGLSERVQHLEGELRRLAEEVSTDQLTQIANRRGLLQVFDAERARLERTGNELTIGLLDIDNFKRLNDELGHSAGDEALKSLAAVVRKTLRPTDLVARYGGEEFVVLLPNTPLQEGEQIVTRLQRSLTGGLFMHEQNPVFVTFSAGVTAYRLGEPIEAALERADEALYEAKRTGKNRTCMN